MAGFSSLARALIPAGLRAALYPAMTRRALKTALAGLGDGELEASAGPVVVSGFFDEASGVGRGADLTLSALEAAGLTPVKFPARPALEAKSGAMPVTAKGGAWVIHCNPDEAVRLLAYVDPTAWKGRKRIGYWAWELPVAPPLWREAAKLFHEIWAPSQFAADALKAGGVATTVRVAPHPVGLTRLEPKQNRAAFGWRENEFVVLAMGDNRSSATRKNLAGAIDIYRRAFPVAGASRLVVKTLDEGQDRAAVEAAGGRADIFFVADRLSPARIGSMISSADVVLSPHRSEGFGLVLAEAMLLGVPALATGWSGNMDFMAELPELLIKHSLTPVNDPTGVYRASGQTWAEPDVADAAAKLQRLAASPELRTLLAQRGAETVKRLSDAWTRERLGETALGDVLA